MVKNQTMKNWNKKLGSLKERLLSVSKLRRLLERARNGSDYFMKGHL